MKTDKRQNGNDCKLMWIPVAGLYGGPGRT